MFCLSEKMIRIKKNNKENQCFAFCVILDITRQMYNCAHLRSTIFFGVKIFFDTTLNHPLLGGGQGAKKKWFD